MALRYVLVGLILLGISRKVTFDRDSIKISLFFSASTIFWILGLADVSPGDSAVLTYSMPLFAIPLAILVARDKVTHLEVIGAVVGFIGVITYSITLTHGSSLAGASLTLIGAAFMATYSTYCRKLRDRQVLPLLTTQFLIGSIPMILGALVFPMTTNLTGQFLLDLVYLVVFGGMIQMALWQGMLRTQSVARVTTTTFAIPAATMLWQSLEFHEIPGVIPIVGASIMFLGILVSQVDRLVKIQRRTARTTLPS